MADPVLHLLYVEAFVQQVTAAGVLKGMAVAQLGVRGANEHKTGLRNVNSL